MSYEDYVESPQTLKDIREGKLAISDGRVVPVRDQTISGYISEHGGIKSPADNKVYTSEASYKQHLKDNNLRIMDDRE